MDVGGAGAGWEAVLVRAWRRAQQRSVVGPGDPAVHLSLARDLAVALEAPGRAIDLGSGAGIPGLALAGVWPDSRWTLLDAASRRVALMEETVAELGWGDRVTVLHGRAEEWARNPAHRSQYDLVTSRSFGPPATTAECGVGFLRPGGVLAVTEPPNSDGSRWPAEGLARLGLTPLRPLPGLQRLGRTGALDDRFPRRVGVPTKRPVF